MKTLMILFITILVSIVVFNLEVKTGKYKFQHIDTHFIITFILLKED